MKLNLFDDPNINLYQVWMNKYLVDKVNLCIRFGVLLGSKTRVNDWMQLNHTYDMGSANHECAFQNNYLIGFSAHNKN